MSADCLYRRVLGPRFDELPEVLRQFHATVHGGRARGTFRVVRGKGLLRNTVAICCACPGPERTCRSAWKSWSREIASGGFATSRGGARGRSNGPTGNLLMERFGLCSFSSALVVQGRSRAL